MQPKKTCQSIATQRRLALLCQHFYPEMISTGMHMTELSTGLAHKGHQITVYCAQPTLTDTDAQTNVPTYLLYEGVEIIRVPTWGNPRENLFSRGLFALSFLLSTGIAVWRSRRQFQGIITTTNPPFIGLLAVALKLLLGLPFVTIIYDVYPEIALQLGALSERSPLVWLWSRITNLILRQSKRLVVIGRDMEAIIARKLPKTALQRIQLIPNWSDEKHIVPIPREKNPFAIEHSLQDCFVIQYSGRMGQTHNLEPLLEAAALLANKPIIFQLIGDGAKRDKLKSLAAEKSLQNVQFLPYQPIEILDQVLSAPDLAVVCLEQGFTGLSVPSKTYGIMASGRPILGFLDPQGEIAMVIKEEACGLVLPNPSGQQVAECILQLLADRKATAEMGNNARRAFLQKYTLTHAVNRYSKLLQECFS